jgi:hypothetical protein
MALINLRRTGAILAWAAFITATSESRSVQTG